MRGALTPKIQELSKAFLKREMTTTELRLIPYVQYVMVNKQKLDIAKMNQDDRDVLSRWRKEDYIEGGAGGLSITKEFWDFMCAILWEGYVVGGAENE